MIFKGWTINVEYFSEILHSLRTQNQYSLLFDELVTFDPKADMRDFNAVKRITTAYMKLLFPHWITAEDVNSSDFDNYCLQPAIRRRGIIKEQCHNIDAEFSNTKMPEIRVKTA
jgi:ATP-dependent Lon protease